MEAGVQRCKEIVQNLLGFTRDPNADREGAVSLKEVCLRSLKIVELQTKSQGIEVKLHFPADDIVIRGHLNMLAQALKNILQISIDRVTDRIRHNKNFKALMDIEILMTEAGPEILIHDNGSPEKSTSMPLGLGLSVASQILRDHEAKLEILPDRTTGNSVRISFSPTHTP